MSNERAVDRMPCPKCNSSDANVLYEDGHSYCYSCKTRFTNSDEKQSRVVPMTTETSSTLKTSGSFGAIHDRKISKDTAKKYSTQIQQTGTTISHHIYRYFDGDGNHIANKVREVQGKSFGQKVIYPVLACLVRTYLTKAVSSLQFARER